MSLIDVQASTVVELCPNARIIIELFEMEWMKSMHHRQFDWTLPPSLWPPFAAGSVFSSSMFDALLCQVRRRVGDRSVVRHAHHSLVCSRACISSPP